MATAGSPAVENWRAEDLVVDPWVEVIEACEDAVSSLVGPSFRRWVDVVTWVHSVTTHPEWDELFPGAPIDVEVQRRSSSARYALAHVPSASIFVPDGSWSTMLVVHELAHLAAPHVVAGHVPRAPEPSHGPSFVVAELAIVRRFVGVEAWAALRGELSAAGLDFG